jgi:hypothetical protein
MSEQNVKNDFLKDNSTDKKILIEELISELKLIPQEYLPNLVQIIGLFRQSVTLNSTQLDTSEQNSKPENLETNILAQQHKSLSELTKLWIEEGDEQEQTETWEYLCQALDEDRLSNRHLFP